LIKYTNSVLWRVAKRLSYIEDARCLKVQGTKADGLLVSVQPSTATFKQVADTCLRPCTLCAQYPTYSALYCSRLRSIPCSRRLSICHLWLQALHLLLSTYIRLPSVGNVLVLGTFQR